VTIKKLYVGMDAIVERNGDFLILQKPDPKGFVPNA
jgi:hypothetical protein